MKKMEDHENEKMKNEIDSELRLHDMYADQITGPYRSRKVISSKI